METVRTIEASPIVLTRYKLQHDEHIDKIWPVLKDFKAYFCEVFTGISALKDAIAMGVLRTNLDKNAYNSHSTNNMLRFFMNRKA